MTLEESYERHRKAYVGRPAWAWEDEGRWYALADYYSCMGVFTDADREFIARNGLESVAADVLEYMKDESQGGQDVKTDQ